MDRTSAIKLSAWDNVKGELSHDLWPDELLAHKEMLKGVFIGGCIDRGIGSSFRALAHAHKPTSTHAGWICLRASRRLYNKDLVLHELAHILQPGGHTDKWRNKLIEIGGKVSDAMGMRNYSKKQKRDKQ